MRKSRKQDIAARAERLKLAARQKRLMGGSDPFSSRRNEREAAKLDADAAALLAVDEPPEERAGGEVALPGEAGRLKDPDWLNLNASRERMELADAADVFDLAYEAAESIKAKDATEKMLAHQMAAAHKSAMMMLAEANAQGDPESRARLAKTAVSLMMAFQGGMVALGRYRSGGRQTVVVQHTYVTNGAQAVVTGTGGVGGGKSRNER